MLFNAEYYFDIGGPLRFLLFFDAGQAFLEGEKIDLGKLRTSTGAELRFIMPVLNVPFRLIYAFNPNRDPFQPKTDVQVRRRHHLLRRRRRHEEDVRLAWPSLARGSRRAIAPAQDAAPAAGGDGTPKIAVIDMARISSESLLGKSYAAQLEALENEIKSEGTKKQAELQKLDAAIKALQDELEKQGSVLTPEAADRSARRS